MSKYLIIGGVAGGATTAARLRRLDESAEIIMFERGDHISYANCGLPYYIGNVISDREKLLVQTPESFKKILNVDVRVRNEVVGINPDRNEVSVRNNLNGQTYIEKYDKLILSPGAEPVKPFISGIDDDVIFTLRNVKDTDIIKEYIEKKTPKHAVVIGAGFIGLEMAENMHALGMRVTIVEMAEQVMTPLDYEMAAEVHQHLKTKNVEFYLKDGVSSFDRNGDSFSVRLNSGRVIQTDMVVLSIGVRPETKLAKEAGIEIGTKGGIVVNAYLQTNYPDIYAVGDAIEYLNPIIHKSECTYLAGPANKQARIVADNIVFENTRKYRGSISTAIAKVFDLTVASTGVSEKRLKTENIDYISSITHGSSHAGYYPDAFPMTIKIQFAPQSGKLYGAQIVGYDGVDKRIDLIATVLKNGGTIYDLQEIEHAYAPPFSSAKDPVNIAGFVAENILQGKMQVIKWDELAKLEFSDIFLVDVRTSEEFALGSVSHAVNISSYEIRNRLNEIPKDKKIVLFCGVGLRGYFAARILMQNGFNQVYNLSGGYKTYEHAIQKQSNEDIFEGDYIGKDDHIYKKTNNIDNLPLNIKTLEIDACGLQCPGPILRLKKEIENIEYGSRIKEISSDPGFYKDVQSWCRVTGNKLVSLDSEKGKIVAVIEKSHKKENEIMEIKKSDDKTMVVFSDDLDKALASFVIANGAAATGKKVTMFFTFWGLNVVKKLNKPQVEKDIMGKMFGWMMPSSSKKLKLSKMNMFNLGRLMMLKRMKSKNVESLDMLIKQALENGVIMVACQMSMDVMGIKKEELIDEVEVGGVATYLEAAEYSNVNLFI